MIKKMEAKTETSKSDISEIAKETGYKCECGLAVGNTESEVEA